MASLSVLGATLFFSPFDDLKNTTAAICNFLMDNSYEKVFKTPYFAQFGARLIKPDRRIGFLVGFPFSGRRGRERSV